LSPPRRSGSFIHFRARHRLSSRAERCSPQT
jgi:hypothetical protein